MFQRSTIPVDIEIPSIRLLLKLPRTEPADQIKLTFELLMVRLESPPRVSYIDHPLEEFKVEFKIEPDSELAEQLVAELHLLS